MADFSAIARWPNVPACYGWLGLDRRGYWRLQGEPVTHPGLIDFLTRQYDVEADGRWFVQNGPQRVYVDLAATPLIYRLDQGKLTDHTGQPAPLPRRLLLSGELGLLIDSARGPGLLDDRDLASWLAGCVCADGHPVGEAEWNAFLGEAAPQPPALYWQGEAISPLAVSSTVDLARVFHFVREPRATENPLIDDPAATPHPS